MHVLQKFVIKLRYCSLVEKRLRMFASEYISIQIHMYVCWIHNRIANFASYNTICVFLKIVGLNSNNTHYFRADNENVFYENF